MGRLLRDHLGGEWGEELILEIELSEMEAKTWREVELVSREFPAVGPECVWAAKAPTSSHPEPLHRHCHHLGRGAVVAIWLLPCW